MALVFLLFERLAIILFLFKVHKVIFSAYIISHRNYLCNVICRSRDLISEGIFVRRNEGEIKSAFFSGVMSRRAANGQSIVKLRA